MHLIDSVLACIADDHNGEPCDDVKVSGLKGFFSLYVVNDSKHHDKALTGVRVAKHGSFTFEPNQLHFSEKCSLGQGVAALFGKVQFFGPKSAI